MQGTSPVSSFFHTYVGVSVGNYWGATGRYFSERGHVVGVRRTTGRYSANFMQKTLHDG